MPIENLRRTWLMRGGRLLGASGRVLPWSASENRGARVNQTCLEARHPKQRSRRLSFGVGSSDARLADTASSATRAASACERVHSSGQGGQAACLQGTVKWEYIKDKSLWLFCTPTGFRRFHAKSLESMAGTTGLEPATSAVTVSGKRVTNRNQGQRTTPVAP